VTFAMAEIGFYHQTLGTLERSLPKLLEKILGAGQRAVVLAASAERVDALNSLLWTYDPGSFLPHGTVREGEAEMQPIWLTDRLANPNGARVLVLTDSAEAESFAGFDRVAFLFDGNDPAELEQARTRWKRWGGDGHKLSYLQQTGAGRWEVKASAESATSP
jgi:DNA polymerase III subunit chi